MPGKLIAICTDRSHRLIFGHDSFCAEIIGTTNCRPLMVCQSPLTTKAANGNIKIRGTLKYLIGRCLFAQKLVLGELDG